MIEAPLAGRFPRDFAKKKAARSFPDGFSFARGRYSKNSAISAIAALSVSISG